VAASFWPDRSDPSAAFWLGLAGALGYVALSLSFNHTIISIDHGSIVVRHRPIPWPGRRLAAGTVRALEVTPNPSADTITTTHWCLSALLDGSGPVRLTWGWVVGHRHDLLDAAARRLSADLGIPVR
jgi:hypothetical protein